METTIASRLGAQPFTVAPNALPDGAATRAALKTFAVKCGAPWSAVKFFDMATLRRAYCDRDTLADLIKIDRDAAGNRASDVANATYNPRREEDPTPRPMPGALGAFAARAATVIPEEETPTPMPPLAPVSNAAEALQQALATIAANIATPLDEARVIALIQEHAPKPEPRGIAISINERPAVAIDNAHPMLASVVRWLAAGVHVAIVGPAGTGKTELAQQAAQALGRTFHLCGAMDSPYRLLGFIDAQGRYQRTAFRDAFEHGGLCLLDEADAGSPAALLAVNAALANGHCDFPDGNVKRHPNFIGMLAANTYGRGADRQYVGRNQLDAATLDRFAFLTVDYDTQLESKLAANERWTRRVQSLRAAARNIKARVVISMRASINGAAALAAGVPQSEVEDALIWKGVDDDTRAKIEAEAH